LLETGKVNQLKLSHFTSFGAYLDPGTGLRRDQVLLPGNQIPRGAKEGDVINAFIYRDSEDRLIATTKVPLAQVGQLAYLPVTANTEFGAFLDFGLDRGLFLPFSEQRYPLKIFKRYLVYLYLDKSQRISCTTDIYKYLTSDSPYQKNDKVKGTVYLVKPEIGAFVAVDDKYLALIPVNEFYGEIDNGDKIEARVIRVRDDGKLDLSARELSYKQMESDAEILLKKMEQNKGFLPLSEKASPEEIEKMFNLSKAAYKRAVGTLLKSNKIVKTEKGIKINK